MKQFKIFLLVAAGLTFMGFTPATQNKYTLSQAHTVTIHGTSNLHDWDETVGTVTGDGVIDWNADGSFDLGAMNIKMVVNSIKSTEGSIMNNNTYKALKSDVAPYITFALLAPVKSIPAAGAHIINAQVNLSIAGVTKTLEMPVTATASGHGNIEFEGSKAIKMTDFGIKPPVALFGTMKTGDEITIQFKTVLTMVSI